MTKWKGPWQDGRRAWERLNGWHQDSPSAAPGHPDDGSAALEALADIGLVRHLLDQAELVAVRTARRHSKSWAEIAVKLGITRQSAWERWRELDDETAAPAAAGSPPAGSPSTGSMVLDAAAAEVVELKAGESRQRRAVRVPDVVGLPWLAAIRSLHKQGLVCVDSDLPDPAFADPGWETHVVTDQSPEAGARVPSGSRVTLWRGRGGGSAGVREPRRPGPSPKSAQERRPEPSGEAIG